jgi:transcriptional regulator with XRE-family HTH domain
MTFGEKVKEARRSLNLSQAELAEKTGISERSLYTYEQLGTIPRKSNIKKIADALNVTVAYLMDGDETDKQSNMDEELFLAAAKSQYGYKGAKEAQEVIGKTKALLAGGDLDDEAKDVFFRALMEVYLQSKAEASEKFTPKKYRNQPAEDK